MIQEIQILVEMKKSKQWGWNPHVKMRVYKTNGMFTDHKTSSSGLGYDKRSDAVARALNAFQVVRDWLAKDSVKFSYGASSQGFKVGGVGMDAILKVFTDNGFKVSSIVFDDAHADAYFIHK